MGRPGWTPRFGMRFFRRKLDSGRNLWHNNEMRKVKKAIAKAAVARKKAAAKKEARATRKVAATPKAASSTLPIGDAKAAPHPALREEFTIEARNFGPVKEAKLTLKPLTVLVGPSNTGKTYMATLAYMMTNEHTQFIQAARQGVFLTSYESTLKEIAADKLQNTASQLLCALEKGGDFVALSDLPAELQNLWREIPRKMFKTVTWGSAKDYLGGYFAVGQNIDALIGGDGDAFMCEYAMKTNGHETARVRIEFRKGGKPLVSPKLSGFYFPMLPSAISADIAKMKKSLTSSASVFRKSGVAEVEKIIDKILQPAPRGVAAIPSASFLPASRGGVAQAQRVMSIAMMRIGSRAGLTKIPSIPTLAKPTVDYLEEISILLDQIHSSKRQSASGIISVAEKIEGLLDGEIVAKNHGENGRMSAMTPPPTLAYRPAGLDAELEMAQSSSMVGEIAPLVLYLKGGIESGDTLFVEEPEAHLHPTAQTTMAEILAAMVRAGIRVVITTHSDWMLDAIANLVRQGESGNDDGETTLKADDVGVWLFQRSEKGGGSTAVPVPFDNSSGYIPESLSDFFMALHNKSADLRVAYDQARRRKGRS